MCKYLPLPALIMMLATSLLTPGSHAADPTSDRRPQEIALAAHSCTATVVGCGDIACGCGRYQRGACACEVCVPIRESTDVTKHCWEIECKKVAVPAIRYPWEPGGSPLTLFRWLHGRRNAVGCCDECGDSHCECDTGTDTLCGRVLCVRDLKKHEYEATKCECRWEIRRLPPCNACPIGCPASGCGEAIEP